MSQGILRTLLLIGVVLLPVSYIALCIWMSRFRVQRFTYLSYFFLFGTCGGWCLTIIFPNGPILLIGGFLLSVLGSIACLYSSLVLQFRKSRNRFEQFAMLGGYGYLLILATVILYSWLYTPKV